MGGFVSLRRGGFRPRNLFLFAPCGVATDPCYMW
jgi:hypothetical protein